MALQGPYSRVQGAYFLEVGQTVSDLFDLGVRIETPILVDVGAGQPQEQPI